MYGRVLRLSKQNINKEKTYYKVATKDTAEYFVNLMKGMLCLTDIKWYSTYNGKNMGGMIIPNVVNVKVTPKPLTNRTKSKSVKQYVSIEELGIPLDLSFFKNIKSYKTTHKFTTVAECKLDDVRREFLGLGTPLTINEVKDAISKCTTLKEFKSNFYREYGWCNYNNRTDLVKDLVRVLSKPLTVEEVKDAITKCTTMKEFKSSYPKCSKWIFRNKRYDLTVGLTKTNNLNTEESIIETIRKCSTIEEFRKDYRNQYRWVIKCDRTDLIQHFNLPKRYPYGLLTEEKVINIISQCSTLKELREQYSQVMGWCIYHNRKDLYKDLQREVKRTNHTLESVIDNILKCSTLYELKDKYMTSYSWCRYHNRKDLYQHLYKHPTKIRNSKV